MQALRASQAEVHHLQNELAVTQSRLTWTPEARQFAELEKKIADMEAESAARDKQWKFVLEDSRQLAGAQAELTRRRCELALEAKSAEIEGFRAELDALILAAKAMRSQQVQQQDPQH